MSNKTIKEIKDYKIEHNCFYWKHVPKNETNFYLWPILSEEVVVHRAKTTEFNVPICNHCNNQLKQANIFLSYLSTHIFYCDNCKIRTH